MIDKSIKWEAGCECYWYDDGKGGKEAEYRTECPVHGEIQT